MKSGLSRAKRSVLVGSFPTVHLTVQSERNSDDLTPQPAGLVRVANGMVSEFRVSPDRMSIMEQMARYRLPIRATQRRTSDERGRNGLGRELRGGDLRRRADSPGGAAPHSAEIRAWPPDTAPRYTDSPAVLRAAFRSVNACRFRTLP
jgi:hypothetical protein